jgi:hypothetical protein
MPVNAKFTADFSDFNNGVAAATDKLADVESAAAKAGTAVQAVGNKLEVDKMLHDVAEMAKGIDMIGGASKLTAEEIKAVGEAAEVAKTKLVAWGVAVPPELEKITSSLKTVAPAMTDVGAAGVTGAGGVAELGKALDQADKTLGLAGIHITKELGTLKELGAVAGKTAGEIGALGTAGLVVGTAMAAWNVGRQIAGWLDLDKAIGDTTAAILGWGNAAEQVALSQVAELTAATNRATREITDLGEARRINAAAVAAEEAAAKKAKTANDEYLKSVAALNALDLDWHVTLQTLTKDQQEWIEVLIKLGGHIDDIARSEHFTENQVRAVANAIKERTEKENEYAEAVKKVQQIENGQVVGHLTNIGVVDKAEEAATKERLARWKREQEAFQAAVDKEVAAAKQFNQARDEAASGFKKDPIQQAAEERDAGIAFANKAFPQGGADFNALMQMLNTKFQELVDAITNPKVKPQSPTANFNISMQGVYGNLADLQTAFGRSLMQSSGAQWPSR